jgi:HNH endonuclease
MMQAIGWLVGISGAGVWAFAKAEGSGPLMVLGVIMMIVATLLNIVGYSSNRPPLTRQDYLNAGAPMPDWMHTTRPSMSKTKRNSVLARDGYQCQHCGSGHDLQIDHVRPLALGGGNNVDNLQVLCKRCNTSKGARFVG